MRKTSILFAFLALLAASLAGRIAIFPFQVSGQNHASLQWLGKAVSYHLLTAFDLNALPVLSEEEVQRMLNQNHIRFPFSMTKATAMALAQENGATALVWGRIAFAARDSDQMSIQVTVVDLEANTQKELPQVRGRWGELFTLLQEAARGLMAERGRTGAGVQMPGLAVSLADFEKLVKSLLLTEPDKKLELLLPVARAPGASDFVFWEAAKALVQKQDWPAAEGLLLRLSEQPYFRKGKSFLLALVACGSGRIDAALERFLRLQQEKTFSWETQNNLGVIDLYKGNYAQAQSNFRQVLASKPDPEVWANLIYLLRLMNRPELAFSELCQALAMFPDDERLHSLFSHFLSSTAGNERLLPLLQEYIPSLHWPEAELRFGVSLKNPFAQPAPSPEQSEARSLYVEARNHFLEGDTDQALDQLDQALELNPFLNEFYHLLGLIQLQKRDLSRAEAAASLAMLLQENEDNYLLLIKVLLAAGNRERAKELADAARKRFPASVELQSLSIK